MNPTDTNAEIAAQLHERLKELPKVVQDAILSADVEKHLRDLATSHKLHLDQWQILENEVMLTLLGFEQPEDLETNIVKTVGIPTEEAHSLASDISSIVFEPIRQKLELALEHPDAQEEAISNAEAARAQILETERAESVQESTTPAPVQPATPPAPAPQIKITRPSDSAAYKPGEASSERKAIHDDPYREPPV